MLSPFRLFSKAGSSKEIVRTFYHNDSGFDCSQLLDQFSQIINRRINVKKPTKELNHLRFAAEPLPHVTSDSVLVCSFTIKQFIRLVLPPPCGPTKATLVGSPPLSAFRRIIQFQKLIIPSDKQLWVFYRNRRQQHSVAFRQCFQSLHYLCESGQSAQRHRFPWNTLFGLFSVETTGYPLCKMFKAEIFDLLLFFL